MGVTKQKKPRRRMKAEPKTAPTSADFTVVLEDLRSNFAVFGEALQVVREEMGQRFEQVDRRFEQIDHRFEQIDRRFDRMKGELGALTTDMTLVKSAVIDLARANKGRVGG
jgi:septal ring factor EnvC (AmiA/AmiB activator)